MTTTKMPPMDEARLLTVYEVIKATSRQYPTVLDIDIEVLSITMHKLGLISTRCYNVLRNEYGMQDGWRTIRDLARKPKREIVAIQNVGKHTYAEIELMVDLAQKAIESETVTETIGEVT